MNIEGNIKRQENKRKKLRKKKGRYCTTLALVEMEHTPLCLKILHPNQKLFL